MDKTFIEHEFDKILTVSEIARELLTTPDNIRMHIMKKNIPERFYQKRGRITLFHHSYIRYHLTYNHINCRKYKKSNTG